MADLGMDDAAVRALARRVLDGADVIDGFNWATIDSGAMPGSAVARAAPPVPIEERVIAVVAHMREWAAAAQAAATAIDGAEARHARQLGDAR